MRFNDPETIAEARKLRANMTPGERKLWSRLRGRRVAGAKFRRQHPMFGYVVDFFCHRLKLAIEVDGQQHNTRRVEEADALRDQHLELHGVLVHRVSVGQVLNDIDTVIAGIEDVLAARANELTPPTPSRPSAG